MKEIEVVLSMPLFHHRMVRKRSITVVIDILRSTTSIIGALDYGVKSIIPVSSHVEAEVMKADGYILAAEEEGVKISFADYGISVDEFWKEELIGKEIVFNTPNGTKAFRLTREETEQVLIGGFPNLSALTKYILKQNNNVLLVCAGSNNMPSLEDQIFAGALAQKLMESGLYESNCDSLHSSIDVWNTAKKDIFQYIKKLSHRKKYPNVLSEKALQYTFTLDACSTIPVLHFNHITALKP